MTPGLRLSLSGADAVVDVFISYSHEDRTRADALAHALNENGYTVWWDRQIRSGAAYHKEIEQALHSAKAVIVLWSKASRASEWVRDEAQTARDADKYIPLLAPGASPPLGFGQFQCLNMQDTDFDRPLDACPELRQALEHLVNGAAASAALHDVLRAQAPAKKTRGAALRRLALPGMAAAATALIAALAALLFLQPPDAPVEEQSIAVLPFRNLSHSPEDAYFSTGVAEEILNLLARETDMRVVARSSAFPVATPERSVSDIANLLRVGHVLEGSVRREADRVRITVQLIDAENGFSVWSDVYERKLENIFALQSSIAGEVATALQTTLHARPSARAGTTSDVEAYELYLRGKQLLAQRGEEPLRQSIALFETALARDPDFADAWTAKAMAWKALPGYARAGQTQAMTEAATAARRALTLQPHAAEAHAVLGAVHAAARDWTPAETRFKDALAAGQNNATAHFWYAEFLTSVGRYNDSLPHLERAYELDPLSPTVGAGLAWTYVVLGRLDEGEALLLRSWRDLGLKALFIWEGLFTIALERADYAAARALVAELPDPRLQALPAAFLGALESGDPAVAAALSEQVQAAVGAGQLEPGWAIEVLARLGDGAGAVALCRELAASDAPIRTQALFTPGVVALRAQADFFDLTDELGLNAFWRASGTPDFCADGGCTAI